VRRTKIKICGITNEGDAKKLSSYPIDSLGFIVTRKKIPSRIAAVKAAKIIAKLSPFITSVVGFAYLTVEEIVNLWQKTKPDALQIQYRLAPKEVREVKKKLPWVTLIKTIHVNKKEDCERAIKEARRFISCSDALLLDSSWRWGSDLTFKQYLKTAAKIVKLSPKPVILAGGLNAQNVGKGIRVARPYAVDLISGVETIPGKKDFAKVEKFIKSVRKADRE